MRSFTFFRFYISEDDADLALALSDNMNVGDSLCFQIKGRKPDGSYLVEEVEQVS